MYEDLFAERIALLRNSKNVSAREMSLAIGQNESYINRIENKHAFPSLQVFFYICDYLGITPKDFFDMENPEPEKINAIAQQLKRLNSVQLDAILALVKSIK
ncbi:MAG: helix-turn-helix domain-containing protein [Lachnospiraceae bacterium]